MTDPRTIHGHRARPLAGGLSLLLLVTVAIANPAGGFQPLLAELTSQTGHERSAFRALSGRLVQAVRIAARRAPRQIAVRPARAWDVNSRGVNDPAPRIPWDAGAAASLVRVELLDLPPPRA